MLVVVLSSLILFFSSSMSYANEHADAFIVQVLDEKVKVVSPKESNEELTVIIQNKTLVKVIAKLEGDSGIDYSYFSISPGQSQAQKISSFNDEPIYLKPLSPALQKVYLKIGSLPYEIPGEE